MMKYKFIFLIVIVAIALFSRLWLVTSVPPSLYWDEVSQGFNAYLISETGKDEHQEFLPLARFVAFGDYKAPVYTYLIVPFLTVLGKTELAVRLPSILLGSATVLVTYFLTSLLLSKYPYRTIVGLLAAFFLAISPRHVQLSRAAYEGNVATFFTVLGFTLFFYALNKKPWLIIISGISFVLALYSFNAHRVFIPLILLVLGLLEWKNLLHIKKQVITAGIVSLILLIPFLGFLMTPESKLRFNEVNIFSDVEIVRKSNLLQEQDAGSPFDTILHNRRVLFAHEYVINYFDFFNPSYLFFSGDVNPRFSHQANGLMYLWMLPLLLIGFYQILVKRGKVAMIVIGWFLLAPVVAATARETPHALRSETFIPIYEMIAALGAVTLYFFLAQYLKKYAVLSLIIFLLVVSFSLTAFWHNYVTHNPTLYSYDWQYGYKEVISEVKSREKDYDKIYFTNAYGRAYIYLAWYGDYSPEKFWQEVDMRKDESGLYNVNRLGKYYFTNDYSKDTNKRILFVTPPDNVPENAKTLWTNTFLNGDLAFVISEKHE